jgi:hypothetical protein
MRVCLFEDSHVWAFAPLILTRTLFELPCGRSALGLKQISGLDCRELGMRVRPALAASCRLRWPDVPINDDEWLRAGPLLLVNGRWLPGRTKLNGSQPVIGSIGKQAAYLFADGARAKALSHRNLEGLLERWANELPCRPAGGRLLNRLWDLVELNAELLRTDNERSEDVRFPSARAGASAAAADKTAAGTVHRWRAA